MTQNLVDEASRQTWVRRLAPAVAIVTLAGLIAVSGANRDEDRPSTAASVTPGAEPGTDDPSANLDAAIVSPDGAATADPTPETSTNDPSRRSEAASEDTSTSSPAAGADERPAGPGITDDKITIGIGWFDINALITVLAPTAERSSGTTKDAADAIVRWLNDHGGMAGRQIEPIYHEYPAQEAIGSKSVRSTREQAMCSDFTEDHQAFAAVPWIASMGVFYECAAQHNLVTIATSWSEGLVDETMFQSIGHVYYVPHSLLLDRRERMLVSQLERRGFFAPDAKVAVVLKDQAETRRAAERSLYPALEAVGADVVETAYYSEIDTPWNNIILRFRGAGVTHVVWGSSSSTFIPSGQFMTASESQGYRPFNGLGSDHGIPAQTLVTPAAQRERIVAVGWSPLDEGADHYEPKTPINNSDALCRQIWEESGSSLRLTIFVPYCDALFFIKQGLESSPALTAEGFRSNVESSAFQYPIIDAWVPAWNGRHDGAGAVRDIVYDGECECFTFTGPLHPID